MPNKVDISQIKFRAHSMGDLMSGVAKGWAVDKSVTCQRELVAVYRELKYGRRIRRGNNRTEKGITCEQDGLTLYTLYKETLYNKNSVRLENDWFSGEIDTFKGKEIRITTHSVDVKCPYTMDTMPSPIDKTNTDYAYQGHTYMDLVPTAQVHTLAYTLVNTGAEIINDEKRRMAWKMNSIDNETVEYKAWCMELEKNHIFDLQLFRKHFPYFEFHSDVEKWDLDIPIKNRVFEINILRDETAIQKMRSRVEECREWLTSVEDQL